MPNFKLLIEFDGTAYYGWQRQPDRISIQALLEEKVERITGGKVRLTGSGRTDSGVHAFGYVASFVSGTRLHPRVLHKALNSMLPDDIVIKDVTIAADDFHARFSALAKVYNYFILNRDYPTAIYSRYAWFVRYPISIEAIRMTVPFFLGKKDFTSFAVAASGRGRDNTCDIEYLRIRKKADFIIFSIKGDRFLHHMVRNIVGTLVDIGRGRFAPGHLEEVFSGRDRSLAGITAPAKGLFLRKVFYPDYS